MFVLIAIKSLDRGGKTTLAKKLAKIASKKDRKVIVEMDKFASPIYNLIANGFITNNDEGDINFISSMQIRAWEELPKTHMINIPNTRAIFDNDSNIKRFFNGPKFQQEEVSFRSLLMIIAEGFKKLGLTPNPNIWVNIMAQKLRQAYDDYMYKKSNNEIDDYYFIIDDLRFDNEKEMLKYFYISTRNYVRVTDDFENGGKNNDIKMAIIDLKRANNPNCKPFEEFVTDFDINNLDAIKKAMFGYGASEIEMYYDDSPYDHISISTLINFIWNGNFIQV
jgi:hypothetical protein